jgi:hypothetical protein
MAACTGSKRREPLCVVNYGVHIASTEYVSVVNRTPDYESPCYSREAQARRLKLRRVVSVFERSNTRALRPPSAKPDPAYRPDFASYLGRYSSLSGGRTCRSGNNEPGQCAG